MLLFFVAHPQCKAADPNLAQSHLTQADCAMLWASPAGVNQKMLLFAPILCLALHKGTQDMQ